MKAFCSLAFLLFTSLAQAQPASLEALLSDPLRTHQGRIQLSGIKHRDYYRGYRCPTFEAATAVVATLQRAQQHEKNVKKQRAVLRQALSRQACSPAARGEYRPHRLGPIAVIEVGFEANEDWAALHVTTPDCAEAGLVFDASVYAME